MFPPTSDKPTVVKLLQTRLPLTRWSTLSSHHHSETFLLSQRMLISETRKTAPIQFPKSPLSTPQKKSL